MKIQDASEDIISWGFYPKTNS